MTTVEYPWPWLEEAVSPMFTVRYPWLYLFRGAVRGNPAGGGASPVCLLVPAASGSLAAWQSWMAELIADRGPITAPGPSWPDVVLALERVHAFDEPGEPAPAVWIPRFLAAARRHCPHVQPTPLIVADPERPCADALRELLQRQSDINYPLIRPVLLAHTAPAGWGGVIRYGTAEPIGDLYRLQPTPSADPIRWTKALLALTAVWEAGTRPALAAELWEDLTSTRSLPLSDTRFDKWLDGRLNTFAARTEWLPHPPLPEALAFAPLRADQLDDQWWQSGAVGCEGDWFDLSPTRARTWNLEGAAADAVARRRVVNVPLARWLAAWAASVEEGLRGWLLRHSGHSSRGIPPRNAPAGARHAAGVTGVPQVGTLELADLIRFTEEYPGVNRGLLQQYRVARNRVVHQRRVQAADFLAIAEAVHWLADQGL